ncbi:Protein NDUFAF4 homolog [Eumeta japonica]|uniref:Protein NDUFAF4 homolog n=1 Tax=Eumeta variegata TaxID=151549 RepID=A0A4C1W1T1_EUMVA|nr:Protein NDUFAF4 homolog [Eumeta japonica]
MGNLITKALRPIKNFNVENRAHRVISQEKPVAAPKYPSNIEDLNRAMELEPDLDEKLSKKDEALQERLRSVYVTSTGKPEDDLTRQKDSGKALPQDRKIVEDFEYGLKEPDHIPYGRTTIRNALNFIASHQANPTEFTASKIAFEYKLKEEYVEDILKYFKTFEIFMPGDKDTPPKFAGPAHFRKLTEQRMKELEAAEKETLKKSEPYKTWP